MTMTAEQQRQEAGAAYNAALGHCPARQLLEAISSKWVTLVMLALAEGRLRHSELRRQIPGASQKMLTSTLRTLERDGLLSRTVTASVPVRTDYQLTGLGRSLLGLIYGMKEWAEHSMPAVLQARVNHDNSDAPAAATNSKSTNSPI